MPARVSPGWTASWQAPMEQLPPLLVFWWWCMAPAWCWPCGATENRSSTRTARNSREITMMHQNTCGLEYSEIHWNLKSTHLVALKKMGPLKLHFTCMWFSHTWFHKCSLWNQYKARWSSHFSIRVFIGWECAKNTSTFTTKSNIRKSAYMLMVWLSCQMVR